MNKYLIACFDSFSGENTIELIEANSQDEAMKLYAERKGYDIQSEEDFNDIQELFAGADQYLSDPFEVS